MFYVRRYAWRVLPLLVLVVLYWPGLTNWFYQDDFGWLNLRRDVHSFGDLWPALFAPKAHGNMRPLGENAYFLAFSSLFGVDALPFRICAFVTAISSLVLLGSIAARLTRSRTAGFCAQILWMVNLGFAVAMCWSSIYNQILSSFFFLLAFYFLLRHMETSATRFYAAEWAAFVLGLGALEINVVYPAVAAVYALLFKRGYLRSILPMFAFSAVAVAIHLRFAPPPAEGVYATHFDAAMASTFWTYCTWALGPARSPAIAITCATAILIACRTIRGDRTGLFGAAWFAITIAPYLPLRDHTMDYYLVVPAIGIALIGSWAIAVVWHAKIVWRIAAVTAIGLFLATSIPAAWNGARWHQRRGTRVEDLVSGVAEIHDAQPGKIILLDGIDNDLFWSGIVDVPFRVMEIPHVYLAPGAEARIQAPPELLIRYILPQALALRALQSGTAVVYAVDGVNLRNISTRYLATAAQWKPEEPRFINLGDPLYAGYLGPGWPAPADGFRFLNGTGSVRIAAPRGPAGHLFVTVFQQRAPQLRVQLNGADLPPPESRQAGDVSELQYHLPETLAGKPDIEISLSNIGTTPLKFGFVEVR